MVRLLTLAVIGPFQDCGSKAALRRGRRFWSDVQGLLRYLN